jgi:hypothetical protein
MQSFIIARLSGLPVLLLLIFVFFWWRRHQNKPSFVTSYRRAELIIRRDFIIWIVIGALVQLVGSFLGHETSILYNGVGNAVITCVALGVLVIRQVRVGSMNTREGISVLLSGTAICVFAPTLILFTIIIMYNGIGAIGSALFFCVFQTIWNLGVGILSFVTFGIAVLCIHRR